jgi:hypothetical protein
VRIEIQLGIFVEGQRTSSREVIGVEVSVENVSNGPTVLAGNGAVDLEINGRVDHDTAFASAYDVRQTSFTPAANLNDRRATNLEFDVVVGVAPRTHATVEHGHDVTGRAEYLGALRGAQTSGADRDHGKTSRDLLKSISELAQRNIDRTSDPPRLEFVTLTNIHESALRRFIEECDQLIGCHH